MATQNISLTTTGFEAQLTLASIGDSIVFTCISLASADVTFGSDLFEGTSPLHVVSGTPVTRVVRNTALESNEISYNTSLKDKMTGTIKVGGTGEG
jgi:hypothetical protein